MGDLIFNAVISSLCLMLALCGLAMERIPCMTVMSMMTVFLEYPLARAVTVMLPFFYPKRGA